MIYPLIAIQMPNGSLCLRCSYCNGGGKMTRYTSDSNNPGSKEGVLTKTPCVNCGGKGYDANNPIKVIPLAEFAKPKRKR